MAICPHCGREVPDDAIYCPYCGKKLKRKKEEEIEVKIDDFIFHIKKTKNTMRVCGYRYNGPNEDAYDMGFNCSFIRPDTRAFYIKLIELWKNNYTHVVQQLLKYAGYEVSIKELEERFKEAENYLSKQAEKWERIRRAWGL